MREIKHRKIYDFSVNPKNIISGGRIESYWQFENLRKIYFQKRKPEFPFKSTIDYIDQDFICKVYRLKGFEYGNWVTQEERLNFLICGHISLFDLSKIMQFPSNNLGFNNKLGIAFGARGSSGAIAHFEPSSFMINLTRLNGWRSLAHEYGHALDFYYGGYIDQSRQSFSLSGGHSTVKYLEQSGVPKNTLRYAMNDLINNINTVLINNKLVDSESYKRLKSAKDGTDYWFRRTEIFARFFERYVMYRLSKLGIKNTFLAKEKYVESVYISKTDFNRVLPKMNILVKLMGGSV